MLLSMSTLVSLSAAIALSCSAISCGQQASAHSVVASKQAVHTSDEVAPLSDKPLQGFQLELIDLAFETASALPAQPHLKNRARLQESVVAACFELDQPQRALAYIEKIDNWRRAAGYADYAFYCAEHGSTKDVQRYLDLAAKNSPIVEDDSTQDWQRDRIKATIAKTHVLMGEADKAVRFETGIVDSEMGMIAEVRARLLTPEAFDREIQTIDSVVATNNFDQVRNALANCTRFFDRFYADKERRTLAEQKIKTSWAKLPIVVRIGLMKELAGIAVQHRDTAKALELVDETQALVDAAQWTPEDRIPLMARMAELRFGAGDIEKARTEVAAALALFDAEREKIVNIYRAEVLRPVAEAHQSMGDQPAALTTYKRVVEEGVVNPNSRPRTEDLSATCCSMAVHGVEPDTALKARVQEIHDGLGTPW